jgi:flagella basal body P-ring formation protein FlgA
MRRYYVYSALCFWLLLTCLWGSLAGAAHAANEQNGFRLMLEDVEKAVSDALTEKMPSDHIRATVTSTRESVLHNTDEPAEVSIESLTYKEKRQSWSANLLILQDGEVTSAMPLSGRFEVQRALPVLLKRMRHGQTISEDDITMQFFPETRIRRATVTNVNQIIGKTPERAISKHRPIRTTEIQSPVVLEEGSTVHMRYKTPSMTISTMGEAMEDGGQGEVIRVRNLDSKKVVRAKVVSGNEVVVGTTATNP